MPISTALPGSKQPRRQPRTRDADATRGRMVTAAAAEFARRGFEGARVDAIAARAKANKQLIYRYFGSKEQLFLAVLELAYRDIREAETQLDLDHLDPVAALRTLVTFTWEYYLAHPEFLALVTDENLHRARHLKQSTVIREMHVPFRSRLRRVLQRGVREKKFRRGVDPDQLNLTIAAIGYYYLNNRFTNSVIYETELAAPKALADRLAFNIDTVLRMVLRPRDGGAARTGLRKGGSAE